MNNQAFDSVKQLDAEAIRLHKRNAKAMAYGDAVKSAACREAIIINRGRRAAMHQRVMKECGALALIAMRAKEANKRERLNLVRGWDAAAPNTESYTALPASLSMDGAELLAPRIEAAPNAVVVTERNPSRREQVVKVQAQALALKYMLTDEQAQAVEAFGLAMARVHPHG